MTACQNVIISCYMESIKVEEPNFGYFEELSHTNVGILTIVQFMLTTYVISLIVELIIKVIMPDGLSTTAFKYKYFSMLGLQFAIRLFLMFSRKSNPEHEFYREISLWNKIGGNVQVIFLPMVFYKYQIQKISINNPMYLQYLAYLDHLHNTAAPAG